MAKRNAISVSVHVLVLSLLAASVAIAGRERTESLLKSFGNPSILGPSFNQIHDTSNYGIMQLNNGLARTPQMGFVSLSLSLELSLQKLDFSFL